MIKLGVLVSLFFATTTSIVLAEPVVRHGSCGTHQFPTQEAAAATDVSLFATGTQRVIYLNRFGGKYTISSGTTDASKNIVNQQTSQGPTGPMTIPAMEAGFDWPRIAKCVTDHYKNYNIRITETEPTSDVPYVEAVVGGYGTELGFGTNVLFGIASADNFCNITEHGIAFSFSRTHEGVPKKDEELCATIAHEVGHLLALEHEQLPKDLLSYVLVSDLGIGTAKTFANETSACGTAPGQAQQCSCANTGGAPNSSKRLTEKLGAKPTETNPPALSVSFHGEGGRIGRSFEVTATASDAEGMADVRVLVNGVETDNAATATGNTYQLQGKGSDGAAVITVIARDLAGNETKKDINVTITRLELGEGCVANDACKSDVCALTGDGTGFCTQVCDPAADTCPADFACDEVVKVCAPTASGGCCSVGSDRNGAIAMLLALGVGGVMLRRRRR